MYRTERDPEALVTATILIKKAAAAANLAAGKLPAETGRPIIAAADEVLAGNLRDQFIVAACIARGADDIEHASRQLLELNLGATAVGTGLNTHTGFREAAVKYLREYTGLDLRPAENLFRVTQSVGDVSAYSGAMRRLSIELGKVASDLRLLSMGPRAGVSEIVLPAVQPGSSIMPGEVNPSMPEMVNQVCHQVGGATSPSPWPVNPGSSSSV